MSETNVVEGVLVDPTRFKRKEGESIHAFTQRVRQNFVEDLTSTGSIPIETGDRALMLKALSDLDNQIFTQEKIEVQRKSNDNTANSARLLEEALLLAEQRNVTIPVQPRIATQRERNFDPSFLPEPTYIEGELETRVSTETSEEFFERMEAQNPELRNGPRQDE